MGKDGKIRQQEMSQMTRPATATVNQQKRRTDVCKRWKVSAVFSNPQEPGEQRGF